MQALAAAQAIAARLSASMGGAAPVPAADPQAPLHPFAPPPSLSAPPQQNHFAPPPMLSVPGRTPQQSSIAAAQAIAARIAAQQQSGSSFSAATQQPPSSYPSAPSSYSNMAPPQGVYSHAAPSRGHGGAARGQSNVPVGPGGMQLGSSRRMWDEVEMQRDRQRASGGSKFS